MPLFLMLLYVLGPSKVGTIQNCHCTSHCKNIYSQQVCGYRSCEKTSMCNPIATRQKMDLFEYYTEAIQLEIEWTCANNTPSAEQ